MPLTITSRPTATDYAAAWPVALYQIQRADYTSTSYSNNGGFLRIVVGSNLTGILLNGQTFGFIATGYGVSHVVNGITYGASTTIDTTTAFVSSGTTGRLNILTRANWRCETLVYNSSNQLLATLNYSDNSSGIIFADIASIIQSYFGSTRDGVRFLRAYITIQSKWTGGSETATNDSANTINYYFASNQFTTFEQIPNRANYLIGEKFYTSWLVNNANTVATRLYRVGYADTTTAGYVASSYTSYVNAGLRLRIFVPGDLTAVLIAGDQFSFSIVAYPGLHTVLTISYSSGTNTTTIDTSTLFVSSGSGGTVTVAKNISVSYGWPLSSTTGQGLYLGDGIFAQDNGTEDVINLPSLVFTSGTGYSANTFDLNSGNGLTGFSLTSFTGSNNTSLIYRINWSSTLSITSATFEILFLDGSNTILWTFASATISGTSGTATVNVSTATLNPTRIGFRLNIPAGPIGVGTFSWTAQQVWPRGNRTLLINPPTGATFNYSIISKVEDRCSELMHLYWINYTGMDCNWYFKFKQELSYTYPNGSKVKRVILSANDLTDSEFEFINTANVPGDIVTTPIVQLGQTNKKQKGIIAMLEDIPVTIIPSPATRSTQARKNSIAITVEYPENLLML